MTTYAILPRWQANRVYGAASLQLAQAEVDFVVTHALAGTAHRTDVAEFGAVPYLLFHRDGPLTDIERRVLSNVSLLHALFEHRAGDTLVPLAVERRAVVDDDVVTIQRYTGKTNEQFTHLLVNLALAAAADGFARLLDDKPLRVLDPVCGRGTTLNHAVLYGMDALGVEADRRDVEAYEQFILTWLKDKRMKHMTKKSKFRRGETAGAHTLHIAYRATKEGAERVIEVVRDDTGNTAAHVAKKSVDVIVADLPYGVQHGGRADDVLEAGLPAWTQVLRTGGAMALAWNRKTTDRARMTTLLHDHGLRVCETEDAFLHRVDRTITRDVIVATTQPS